MSFWTPEELSRLDFVTVKTTVGGVEISADSPGVCELSGDGIPRNWQTREGFGLVGMTQAFRGLGLAEFQIELRLWETEHRALFTVFDKLIEPSPPGVPERVYKIEHPVLALRGITQCTFLNAPFVKHGTDGAETVIYKCRQWRKPLPTLTTATAPGAGSAEGNAFDAWDQRRREHLNTINNLLGADTANRGLSPAFNQFLPGPRA